MEEPPMKKHKKKRAPPLKATIHLIGRQPGKSEPVIAYFPSGYDPLVNEPNASRVTVLKHKRESHRMEMRIKPPESDVQFVGTSRAGEGVNPQSCAFALGVLDKTTGTLKIVNIASDEIIRLHPTIHRLDEKQEPSNQLVLADMAKKLNQAYGTKKSKSAAKKLEALHQTYAPEAAEELERKLRSLKSAAPELDEGTVNNRGVPYYNIEATTPQQAYPLDKIISEGEWNHLLDIHELVRDGFTLDRSVYPSFVRNRVSRLNGIKDEAEKLKIACIFSYITHLIKFKDQHSAEASSVKNHHIPGIIKQKFSTMFTTPEMKILNQDKISLLINFVLVLTLFVDDFRTDLADIAKDLRMSIVLLRNHVRYLGCKLVKDNKTELATLSVPLEFPTQGNGKKRRH